MSRLVGSQQFLEWGGFSVRLRGQTEQLQVVNHTCSIQLSNNFQRSRFSKNDSQNQSPL